VFSTLLPASGWDPFAFIDLCQRYAQGSDPAGSVLQQIQALETEVLLEHFSEED
jgi:hypothetical protein